MSVGHVGAVSDGFLETDLGLIHPTLGVQDVAEIAEGLGRIDLETGSEEGLLVSPVLVAENSSGGGRQDHDEEADTRGCCQDFAAALMSGQPLVTEAKQQAEPQRGQIQQPLRHHKTNIEE